MKNIQKNFLLIIIIFSLGFYQYALALETKFPVIPIPEIPTITSDSKLPDLIRYFFGLGIAFSGVIALISLAIAGIQLVIGQANPEGVSSAKDRIRGSLLGIVLLMTSYLILQTVNPVLIQPEVTELASGPGIFLVKGDKQASANSSYASISSIPAELAGGQIEYRCANPSKDLPLLIWYYSKENFDASFGANTIEIDCNNNKFPIPSAGSLKMSYKTPGIYIYNTSACQGYRSNPIAISGEIPEEFKKRETGDFRCVEIINDPANNTYFGTIIHERLDYVGGGNCQKPIVSPTPSQQNPNPASNLKQEISIEKASSITIFRINTNPATSGDGIDFYSGSYGWDTKGSDSGHYELPMTTISQTKFVFIPPNQMTFNYNGTSVGIEEQNNNKTFADKQGSMRIKGSYLVSLYSSGLMQDGYCQVFTKNVVDFKGTEYIGRGQTSIGMVYAIATK